MKCAACESPTSTFSSGRHKKFCDRCLAGQCECGREKAYSASKCITCTAETWRTASCAFCECEFRPRHGGGKKKDRLTRYCSKHCSVLDQMTALNRPVYFPQCGHCEALFTARTAGSSYCSRDCERAANPAPVPVRACGDCGSTVGKGKMFCPPCRRIRRKHTLKQQARKYRHLRKHRARARHHGVEYEPIDRRRVFHRDAWTCGICHGKTDRHAAVPHPKAATLDHIVPMAKGGPHTYANVQAAHFMCNSVKGAGSAGEQLRLVG